jgi:raffinose/stachyose/melibiose transport system permease protein
VDRVLSGVPQAPASPPTSWWGRRRARARAVETAQTKGDRRLGLILILPAAVLLAVFIIYPLIEAIDYSFLNWDGIGPSSSAGLSNYTALWTNSVERQSLEHAGVLICFYSLIPTAFGLIAAALIARLPQRGMGVLRVIYFLPQVLVTIVVAVVWTWILAPSGPGTLNAVLHTFGLGAKVGTPWLGSFSDALIAVGLIAVWLDFGLCFVLFLSGVQRIPQSLYDAARVDGAGIVREFWYITVPMLRREIGVALTITIVASLQSFTLIYQATLGGPGTSTTVPGLLVYRDAFQLGQVGSASALGVALAVLTFAFTFIIRALLERKGQNA